MRSITGFVLQPLFLVALTLAQSNSIPHRNQNPAASSPSSSRSSQAPAFEQLAGAQFQRPSAKSASSPPTGLSFAPGVVYGSGGFLADSVAVGDVNGDGKLDIVAANCGVSNTVACYQTAGTIGVLLGNGNGTFQAAVTYGTGGYGISPGPQSFREGSSVPNAIALADVNGDGKLDIIVANPCADSSCSADGSVGILLGNGDGTFQPAVTYDSGGVQTDSLAIADVNGDGKLDIVVSSLCSNTSSCPNSSSPAGSVSVLLGNGNGTFQTAVVYATDIAFSVALGDMNGDGKPDVAVATSAAAGTNLPGGVSVLLNNGDGTLASPVIYASGGDNPMSLVLADLNGDGKLDIAVNNLYSGSNVDLPGPSELGVLLGNGDGSFQTAVTYESSFGVGLAVADINGDGKPDLVGNSECTYSAAVAVMAGNGDGTFQPGAIFCYPALNGAAATVAIGDMNGDGRPDLIAPGCTSGCPKGVVGVLINTSSTAALSPSSLSFAPQPPGTSSSAQTVTLTNLGPAALTFTISISGSDASGFSETNNCSSPLAVDASCQIKVASVPSGGGTQTAMLAVADKLPGSPQTVALSGTGEDFSIAVSPASTTVAAGQAASYTLTVEPFNGFAQTVNLSCSGAPAQATCTASPASLTLNGSSTLTANLAVVTAGPSARLRSPFGQPRDGRLALWLAFSGLSGLLFTGKAGLARQRPAWWSKGLVVFSVLVALAITWSACGSSSSRTPSGTYTLTLTGTYKAGGVSLTHSATATLTVE